MTADQRSELTRHRSLSTRGLIWSTIAGFLITPILVIISWFFVWQDNDPSSPYNSLFRRREIIRWVIVFLLDAVIIRAVYRAAAGRRHGSTRQR